MPGTDPAQERRDQDALSRGRKIFLIGLACVAAASLFLNRRDAALPSPPLVLAAAKRRAAAAPTAAKHRAPTPPAAGESKTKTAESKTKRPRRRKRKTARPPAFKAPDFMRDAPRAEFSAPLSWKGGEETGKKKPEKPKSRTSRKTKKPRGGAATTARRRPPQAKTVKKERAVRAAAKPKTKPDGAKTAAAKKARPAPADKTPRPDFDGRSDASNKIAKLSYRLPDSGIGRVPSFYTPAKTKTAPPKKKKKEKTPAAPTVAKLLGTGALTPPRADAAKKAPGFGPLKDAFPPSLPDGKSYERRSPPPAHAETVLPPQEHGLYERWLEIDANKGREKDSAHWHGDGEDILYMHYDKVWAAPKDGRWSWLLKSGTAWWTVADGVQRLMRHKERWWAHGEFGWFPLVEGEARAARFAADWKRAGLLPEGWSLKFSADLARAAVFTPGLGTTVFDARSGEFIARIPEKKKTGN